MYAVVLLNAVTLTFGRPARSALLPQLVPEAVFSNAVTWNATVFELSSMLGPALGGLIVAYRSSAQAYLLNGIPARRLRDPHQPLPPHRHQKARR